MADRAQDIFERFGRLGHVARLHGISADMRWDVIGVGSWRVAIDDGSVTVTEGNGPADCVIEVDEETLRRMASGQQKPLIAFMQGLVTVKGDPATALSIAGLFAADAPAYT